MDIKIIIGWFSIFIAIVITIVSCSIILHNLSKNKYYNVPLNIQTQQLIMNSTVYYIILWVLLLLYIVGLSLYVAYLFRNSRRDETAMYIIIPSIPVIIAILGIIIAIISNIYSRKKKFNKLNNEMREYIYKKTAFLDVLKNSRIDNDVSIYDTIKKQLATINLANDTEGDIINKLVTITLFYHFANTCHANGEIDKEDVFKLFSNKDILTNNVSPVKYLKPKNNLIRNILDKLIVPNLPGGITISDKVKNDYNTIISGLNTRANELNLEIPMLLSLTIWTLFLSIILLLIIFNVIDMIKIKIINKMNKMLEKGEECVDLSV